MEKKFIRSILTDYVSIFTTRVGGTITPVNFPPQSGDFYPVQRIIVIDRFVEGVCFQMSGKMSIAEDEKCKQFEILAKDKWKYFHYTIRLSAKTTECFSENITDWLKAKEVSKFHFAEPPHIINFYPGIWVSNRF